MSQLGIILLSLVSYAGGLVVLFKVTPRLLKRKFDEGFFMFLAAADVIGGLLVFAPVGILFNEFNGALTIRAFDIALLLIIGVVALRTAWRSFRPYYNAGIVRSSGILVGGYFLLLLLLAVYAIILAIAQSS